MLFFRYVSKSKCSKVRKELLHGSRLSVKWPRQAKIPVALRAKLSSKNSSQQQRLPKKPVCFRPGMWQGTMEWQAKVLSGVTVLKSSGQRRNDHCRHRVSWNCWSNQHGKKHETVLTQCSSMLVTFLEEKQTQSYPAPHLFASFSIQC